MADDRVCFNCDGFGEYGCKPCHFCGGSGLSPKLKAIFDTPVVLALVALVAFCIAALAFGRAFHVG